MRVYKNSKIMKHFQWKILGYVWAKTVRTTRESGLPTDHWTYKLGYKNV